MNDELNLSLFDDDWGIDESKIDDTEITTTLLYYSSIELKDFKRLCKIGIKKHYPDNYQSKGNYADLILHLLRKEYEKDNN